MKLGDTLRKATNMQLRNVTGDGLNDEEVLRYLKPILLSIANKWRKGCKLCFSGISEDIIQKMLDRIKAEDITLLSEDTYGKDEWYAIWDSSAICQKDVLGFSPCYSCNVPSNFPFCSCKKKIEWLEGKEYYWNYFYNEMERVNISFIEGKININETYYGDKETLWKEKENKKLGEVLREAANRNLDEKIFEYLEKTFLSLANNFEKGCKLSFSFLCIDTITKILERIEAEDIRVMDSSLFIEEEAGAWYIIWDPSAVWQKTDLLNSSPCEKCSAEIRISCCGCPKYHEWKKRNSTGSMYCHEEVDLVEVAILSGNIYINQELCYSKEKKE